MHPTHRVFISATSADLASYRQVVKEVLLTNGILPIEQTNFPPDFRSVEAMLEARIRDCDAVVCLVGFVYGAEPADRPADQARRSYTQMEFDIAHRLGKPVYQFIATNDCVFDARPDEDAERKSLQLAHYTAIQSGRQLHEQFLNHEQLSQRIAHIQFGKPVAGQVHPQNLPYVSLGKLFKGRETFLKVIREHVLAHNQQANGAHAAAFTQRQALCGLGGVGKTRLAVEFGWRYDDEYSAVLFLVGDSPENLRRNLALMTGPFVLNLPEQNRQEEEVKMAATIRWLVEHPGWFLILDNVDDRRSAQAVEDLLARIPGGHVLITSRLGAWSKDVETLEVDVLSSEHAKSFLLDRTQERRRMTPSDDSDAALLGRELDGLALALEQAGAFIERRECSLADYLKRWKTGESRVRQWFDPRLMHYPRSVAITYNTTMCEVGPAAAALFRLLSWFAAEPLPQGVLETEKATDILLEAIHAVDGSAPHMVPEDALDELVAFSMIKRTDVQGIPCLSQHRLVQELTQWQIPTDLRTQSILWAVGLLTAFAPKDAYRPEAWQDWRLLIAHAESLWQQVKYLDKSRWNTSLMDGLALYYLGQERCVEAIPIQREIISLKEARLGPDNRETLLARNDLALLLDHVGGATEAERLFRETLAGRERIHDDASEEAAETMFNLANCLQNLGKLKDAEEFVAKALTIFRNVSGEIHWRTLMTEKSLASILDSNGKKNEAMLVLAATVEKTEKYLGPEHPDTLSIWNQHSVTLRKQGHADLAEPIDRKMTAATAKILGDVHPVAIHRRNNLVLTLILLGKLEEARQILAANWRLNAPPHANTTPRLAFLRHLIALLESQPDTPFLGQLKTLLTGPELPVAGGVAVPWDIGYFIDHVKERSQKSEAGSQNIEFLSTLVAALNDRAKLSDLDRFPEWRDQSPVPLDKAWPD